MPKASVVIALYNKGSYVARALDSVLGQSYQDLEVIVVDDGSTDSGPEVVGTYGDPRVRLIRQQNAGPGAARNRGVRESGAPYLAFLDADDEWLPDFLNVSLESLEAHPPCSVSVTSRWWGASRTDLTPALVRRGVKAGAWEITASEGVTQLETGRAMFCMGAFVCKRDVFQRLGGFYDAARAVYGEDTYLWLQLLTNCRFHTILQPLVWIHSEASALGRRFGEAGILPPYFSDPDRLRRNCPVEYRELLEQFLAARALQKAADLSAQGDFATAQWLCEAFPAMRRAVCRYAFLRMMMRLPGSCRVLRHGMTTLVSFGRFLAMNWRAMRG